MLDSISLTGTYGTSMTASIVKFFFWLAATAYLFEHFLKQCLGNLALVLRESHYISHLVFERKRPSATLSISADSGAVLSKERRNGHLDVPMSWNRPAATLGRPGTA
jgi:hypothetical protein